MKITLKSNRNHTLKQKKRFILTFKILTSYKSKFHLKHPTKLEHS